MPKMNKLLMTFLSATAIVTFSSSAMAEISIIGAGAPTKASTLRALVDVSEQRMRVYVDGKQKYSWRVSTGTRATPTPIGSFTPFALTRRQYAKKWNMHLSYVVSLDWKGTAVHGSTITSKLGRRASNGCIRLDPRNAAKFYKLVGLHGLWNTQVVIRR